MSCRFSRWEWKSALGSSCPPTLHSMMYPMVQSSGRRMSSEVFRKFLPLEESRAGWVRRRRWGDTGNHFTENRNKPRNKARNPPVPPVDVGVCLLFNHTQPCSPTKYLMLSLIYILSEVIQRAGRGCAELVLQLFGELH